MNLIKAVKKCRDGKRGFQKVDCELTFIVNQSSGTINILDQDGNAVQVEIFGKKENANWNPTVNDFINKKWKVVNLDKKSPVKSGLTSKLI
ncbi:hypothetical protein [Fructobacillus cardui]|uniref:hypothetical protein n=1 Tax=Fructobacillus cardui TaxID=2893170 RepID=UPI00200A76AB|nr:hypothetical protein [Fructobacillus cardui]MCK8626696.1 hypothetical protein [Fructobacillus cardui]